MKILSLRENPEYQMAAIDYFSSKWPSVPQIIYTDCISHCIHASTFIPQWYLLLKEDQIIGCAGVINNDFISRMDLYPWLCALFIEEEYRGNAYAELLINQAKADCQKAGFPSLYLSTSHIGFYERYGFTYLGEGYRPWNESSRIYGISLNDKPIFHIRQESTSDFPEIYTLIQTAFQTAAVYDGDEHDFAANLQKSSAYIPELGLVAELNGKLIGHIMFTKTSVEQPDGTLFEGLLVAPLSVLLEYRNLGVGSTLMYEGFRKARLLGYKAAFLCGDSVYYNRFGFKQADLFGIQPRMNIPSQYVLGYELMPHALKYVKGILDCI